MKMADEQQGFSAQAVQSTGQALDLVGRLFRVGEPGVVFGTPIVQGERTVVVASEVAIGVGAGAGFGSGNEAADAGESIGGGGGGGGYSFGRPVAVIEIEPEGVRVTPIVDSTKIAVAVFTTVGAMFFAWSRMRRIARG
jgi:uncharacterized spore protein YtfJ